MINALGKVKGDKKKMEVLEKKVSTKAVKKNNPTSKPPIEKVEEVAVEQVPVEPDPQNFVTGTIVGCNLLRLREGANIKTKELVQIPVDSVVHINLDNSTESFYEVTYRTNNQLLIGFCVKEFIRLG